MSASEVVYRRWSGPNNVVTWMSEDRNLNTIILFDNEDVVQITSTMPTTAFTKEELIATVQRLHPGKPVELHPNFNEFQAQCAQLDPVPYKESEDVERKDGHGSRLKFSLGGHTPRASDDAGN
jgi:hypothetical protein